MDLERPLAATKTFNKNHECTRIHTNFFETTKNTKHTKTLRVLMANGQWLMVNLGTTDYTDYTKLPQSPSPWC
jgi:hypothetical protein